MQLRKIPVIPPKLNIKINIKDKKRGNSKRKIVGIPPKLYNQVNTLFPVGRPTNKDIREKK